MYTSIKIKKDEEICIVTIDEQSSLNSLSTSLLKELDNIINELSEDNSIKVIVSTGAGKSFISGANIAEMKDFNEKEAKEFSELGANVFRKIEIIDKVVIAAINGYALGGGCELAISCDIRVASSLAKFGHPELSLGIITGFSGTQRLPRIIGISHAKELLYTGKIIDANEADRLSLVSKVVEPENLIGYCIDMAKVISKKPQFALKQAKKAINEGLDLKIEEGIKYESYLFSQCFSTIEQKNCMDSFLNKKMK